MDFDKGSPAYPDGTPATPVTNDGSELGIGKGEDYDTGSVGFIGYYGDDLSGRAGCSNNNWGVVHVTRRDIPDGKIFRKLLQTSKAEGADDLRGRLHHLRQGRRRTHAELQVHRE